jgi:hypothetical protein
MGSICNQCLVTNDKVCFTAAKIGHLECLKEAHVQGLFWDESTIAAAASSGHLECLKYAHEHGCPWSEVTLMTAAQCSHDCLVYALTNGCPQPLLEFLPAYAAMSGNIQSLKYLHENHYFWDI